MIKKNDWITRTLAVVSLTTIAAVGYALEQDDYENLVLGREKIAQTTAPDFSPSAQQMVPMTQRQELQSESTTLSDGSVVVRNAKVEVPKGEGYEVIISANGQGLLDELRLYEDDYDLSVELQSISEHIAGEIAAEQAQKTDASPKPETAENALQFAVQARQAIRASRPIQHRRKKESERPQLARAWL